NAEGPRPEARPWIRRRGSGSALDRSDLELDGHLFGDQDSAGFEGGIPVDAPVLAVDLGGAFEPDAGVAPRVDGGTGELDVEGDRSGLAPDGEIARYLVSIVALVLDPGRLEADLGILVHGEEVVAAEVGVPVLAAGVDRLGLDRDLTARAGGLLTVELERALELVEVATDLGDHGMAGHEAEAAVGGIDRIGPGELGALDGGGCGGFGGHGASPRESLPSLVDVSTHHKRK